MPNNNYIQNPDHLNRARGYHVAALALFDKGFTTETARKDAIDYLNRAYDVLVKEGIHYALWSQRTRGENSWIWDNDVAKYLDHRHNVPDLHVWAPKHAELYAAFPAQVKLANVLRADRDAIKAAPLIAKPKSKTRALAEARNAVAKTCQICGRPILAERGNIAHHGYQRPGDGWQTASCYGAMKLPFEISRDALGAYIQIVEEQLEDQKIRLHRVSNEEISIRLSYFTGKYNGAERVYASFYATRENYKDMRAEHAKKAYSHSAIPGTFDEVKAREMKSIQTNIAEIKSYIEMQTARYDAWKAVA
jgi:hypothetical protein